MSSFDITAVCWKYGFSRGVRAVKIRIFPHLSFFSLSWVFSLFFCRVPVSALCSCWVLLEFLGWLLQDLLHLELLIHFHLVIAENLLPSSVWLGFFWVFLVFFFNGNMKILSGAAGVANPLESSQQDTVAEDPFFPIKSHLAVSVP